MENSKFQKYDLNYKVDAFIGQYNRALKEAKIVTNIGEYYFPRELRDFIESKAVYAEFRWSLVYDSHLVENERQKTEEAQKIFTWEQFENKFKNTRDRSYIPTLGMEKDIDQQVLYRIIERGGNRIGARRGVLFAQDFELDINIPAKYAIDWSDPYLYEFLKPLIPKLNLNIVCPSNYFLRDSNSLENIEEIRLEEVLSKLMVEELQKTTER